MLYYEFIEGTGCKDNATNYKVYKDLEIMYMNSDMSKSEIYEYGKKLVDNSKSEAEIEAEEKVKAEIKAIKAEIEELKENIETRKEDIERESDWLLNETDAGWIRYHKSNLKWYKEDIRRCRKQLVTKRSKIGMLKSLLH